jgi:hypothetical protein
MNDKYSPDMFPICPSHADVRSLGKSTKKKRNKYTVEKRYREIKEASNWWGPDPHYVNKRTAYHSIYCLIGGNNTVKKRFGKLSISFCADLASVSDPHSLYADPDLAFLTNEDPDPAKS